MRRSSLPLLALALLAAPAQLWAEAPRPHALDWSAVPECPTRAEFERAVRDRLGADPFDGEASRSLQVAIGRDAGRWRATVRVSEGATQHGTQALESEAADCSAIFSAAVAVASVVLSSPAAAPAAPAAPAEPAPAPAPAPVPPPARAAPRVPPPPPAASAAPASAETLFIGLELAQDLVLFDGGDACRPDSDRFDCYLAGTETRFDGTPADHTGKTASGLLPGARRLLLTVAWEIGENVALDARMGGALGPDVPERSPWHFEAGARYFLASPEAPLRGYVGASAGYAAFDTKILVSMLDCAPLGPDCASSSGGGTPVDVDAVDRLGPLFVAGRIGLRWLFSRPHSLGVALAVHVPFPESGVVIAPSLGYALGF